MSRTAPRPRAPLRILMALCATVGCVAPVVAQSAEPLPAAEPAAIAWRDGPSLPGARDHHAVWVVTGADGPYLYVAGGTDYREMFADVRRARVRPDGTLGGWEDAGALPAALGGSSVAVGGGYVVLTGGQVATEGGVRGLRRVPDVHVARVGRDGRLGGWTPGPALPVARFHHPALFHGGRVYVVGGQGERASEAGVFVAGLGADGTLSGWTALAPLPRPRSHHAALIHDGHLYVVGGLDGEPAGHLAVYTDVLRAPILPDGTLGEWRIVSRMPQSYATHSAFVHAGHLWVLGGVRNNHDFVATVWRGEMRDNGSIGPWREVTPGLPLARGHVHETPVVDGRVFSVGGRIVPASPEGPRVADAVHVGVLPR